MNQPPVPLDVIDPAIRLAAVPATVDLLLVGDVELAGQVPVVRADVPVEVFSLGTALPDVLGTDGALVGARVVVHVFAGGTGKKRKVGMVLAPDWAC